MSPPLPPNEAARLEALREYEVLDTGREEAFDDLTKLAAHICGVPMALVSLTDEKRQWFKSRVRVDDTWTPRDVSFCNQLILETDDVFEVHDALKDPRFASSPIVIAGPQIRFYAGARLVTPEGHVLGALCVMDRQPRVLSLEQRAALLALSRRVIAQLELRRTTAALTKTVAEQEQAEARLRQNVEQLAAAEQKAQRLLEVAEKSRRALLSVLEDEKRTGQNLRESEERFRQMTESIDEVFWMTDPVNGSLIYMSPAYERVWGRTCASLYANSNSWVDALFPDDSERIREAARTKQLRGEYNETYRIVRPDGTVRWLHEQAFPVRNAAGVIYRMVGVAQDITEKKELETQFLRSQRLDSIGTLASGIAHDLNNILAPIMMAAPLIRSSTSAAQTEKLLGTIETGTERAAKLLRQLLAFGRGVEGEKGRVAVPPMIQDMLAIAEQTFPKNIILSREIASDLAFIKADATQMHQVLLNLCVNARDAMPQGGTLTLAAQNVHLDAASAALIPNAQARDYVRVSVTDTGTGMTPEIMDKVFNPFFTTKAVGKGTGLGLATLLSVVKSHDGFVTLQSELGRGTTFSVHFPAVTQPEPQVQPTQVSALPPPGHGELVLVVDDEANIRDAVRGILTQQGYAAVTAEDGIDGISRFAMAKDEIKLVFTDLDMPNMSGLAMIRILRTMNPRLKIIASSGVLSRKDEGPRIPELTGLGITTILGKPYTVEQVLRAVHDALGS